MSEKTVENPAENIECTDKKERIRHLADVFGSRTVSAVENEPADETDQKKIPETETIPPGSPTVTADDNAANEGNVQKITPEQVQEALKKMKMPQEIRIDISRAPDFRQFYSIGALGVHNIYDFRISFYNDQPDITADPTVRRIRRMIGSEIILSPVAAAELHRWLGQNLAEYEERFGPIRRIGDALKDGASENSGERDNPKADLMSGYA